MEPEKTHTKSSSFLKLKNFWIRSVDHLGNDPYTDWALIFSVNVLASAILISVGVWVYFDSTGKFQSQSSITNIISTNKTNVSIQTLTHLVEYFDTKKITEESIVSTSVATPDPSKLP